MTLDIRANVFCNVGEVISGQFADEYGQGSGLIRTRGACDIKGLVTPAVGSQISFGYLKNEKTALISRYLLVLSSFADPFRNKTTVNFGCPIVYSDQLSPPTENPKNKEENGALPCSVYENGPIPSMTAQWVLEQALSAINLTVTGVTLESAFSIEEFDFSPGYTQVISDLLISENYMAYVDASGVLTAIDMTSPPLSGPRIAGEKIIDLNPIGFGDLPANEVSATYSYRRLKPPEDLSEDTEENEQKKKLRDWEIDITDGPREKVYGSYTDYKNNEDEPEERLISASWSQYTKTVTTYDTLDRVAKRETTRRASKLGTYGSYFAAILSWQTLPTKAVGSSEVNYGGTIELNSTQTFEYAVPAPLRKPLEEDPGKTAAECLADEPQTEEDISEVLSEITSEESPNTETSVPIRWGIADDVDSEDSETRPDPPQFPSGVVTSYTSVSYIKDPASGITKTVTCVSDNASRIGSLSQAIGMAASNSYDMNGANAGRSRDIQKVMASNNIATGNCTVQIRQEREYGLQKRPNQAERSNAVNEKPSPLEDASEQEFLTESIGTAIKKVFALPYAPDDKISWTEEGGYVKTNSKAAEIAQKFAEIQNRLLLGNRSGISLKTSIEQVPPYPLGAFYVDAAGTSGAFLNNGMTFAFDANGILIQTDGLYWGSQGSLGGGENWLPQAPGVSLPPADSPQTNPDPAPPNSSPAPPDFDPTNPGTIFDDLPTNQDPVYEEEYNPDGIYEPYALKVKLIALVRTRSFGQPVPWSTSPQVQEHTNKVRTFSVAVIQGGIDTAAFGLTGNEVFTAIEGSQLILLDSAQYIFAGLDVLASNTGSTGNTFEKAFFVNYFPPVSYDPWTPIDDEDHNLWLDAADDTSMNFDSGDNTRIQAWFSKSDANNSTNGDLYMNPSGVIKIKPNELNGLNVVDINKSTRFVTTNQERGPVISGSEDSSFGRYHFVMVVKPISAQDTPSDAYNADHIGGDFGGYYGIFLNSTGTGGLYFYTNTTVAATVPLAFGEWVILGGAVYYDSVEGKHYISARINGGNEVKVQNNANIQVSSTAPFYIGYGYGGYSDIEIAEFASYWSYDPATRIKAEGYLAHKWGLADLLPQDHQFKDFPPEVNSQVNLSQVILIETVKFDFTGFGIDQWSPNALNTTLWFDSLEKTTLTTYNISTTTYAADWLDKSPNSLLLRGQSDLQDNQNPVYFGLSAPDGGFTTLVRLSTGSPFNRFFSDTAPPTDWSNFIDSNSFSMFALFQFRTLDNTPIKENMDCVISDESGFFALYGNSPDSSIGLRIFNSSEYAVEAIVSSTYLINNFNLAYFGIDGNNLFIAINGGPVQTIYCPGIFVASLKGLLLGYNATVDSTSTVDISEIICTKSALQDNARKLVEGYLAHKYGYQATHVLPIGHPYKNNTPSTDDANVLRTLFADTGAVAFTGNDVGLVFTDNTP